MKTYLYRVVPKRVVIDVSSFPIGATNTMMLAGDIDVIAYSKVVAVVRCHSGTLLGAGLSVADFVVNADGATDEDPSASDPGKGSVPGFQQPLVTTSLLSGFSIGQMKVVPLPTSTSLLSLSLALTQGPAAGMVRYVLSIDLLCRER